MIHRSLTLASVVLASLVCQPVLHAQDDAQAKFDMQYQEFQETLAKIEQMREAYQLAAADERPAIQAAFKELVAKAQETIASLRTVTRDAYSAAPNESENVTNMMLQLIATDVSEDNYRRAIDDAKFLIDQQCDVEGLFNLAGQAAYAVDDFERAKMWWTKARERGTLSGQNNQNLDNIDKTIELWTNELAIREAEAAADDLPRVKLETSAGDVVVELFENEAPGAVGNFVNLVEKGYYDGLTFHRVLPGFMAQGGCPDGVGSGGPGYKIYCECHKADYRRHFAGTLSMAHAGRDTGGSQFFLTFLPTPHLDGRHTAFGRVIEGWDTLHQLNRVDPRRPGGEPSKIVKATVLRKRDHEYVPNVVE